MKKHHGGHNEGKKLREKEQREKDRYRGRNKQVSKFRAKKVSQKYGRHYHDRQNQEQRDEAINRTLDAPHLLGQFTEKRAWDVFCRLRNDKTMISGWVIVTVRKPTQKQDSKGIDLWLWIARNGDQIKVPVQIKSQFRQSEADKYRKRGIMFLALNHNDPFKKSLEVGLEESRRWFERYNNGAEEKAPSFI